MLNSVAGALIKHIKNRNKLNINLMLIKTIFYIFNVLNTQISKQNFFIYILN
jgi:hypothetical protein